MHFLRIYVTIKIRIVIYTIRHFVIGGEQPAFTMRNYVDRGYRVRFDGYSNVYTYNSVVSAKFEQFFGLSCSCQYVLHTSSADNCKIARFGSVASDNLVAGCPHSSSHLTPTAMRDVMGNGTNVISRILWTGHIMTGNPASNSVSSRYSVIATPKHTTTGSTYTNKSDAEVRKESIFTLMHELSHQLGAPDHYCYGIPDGSKVCSNTSCDICYMGRETMRSCMMTYRYDIEATDEDVLYCSSCLQIIAAHLTDHHQ